MILCNWGFLRACHPGLKNKMVQNSYNIYSFNVSLRIRNTSGHLAASRLMRSIHVDFFA
jgi:hypothetical protein